MAQADAEVFPILREVNARELESRAEWVRQPEPAADEQALDSDRGPAAAGDGVRTLDLDAALAVAVSQGREYITRRESVYLQGLSLTLTRYEFGPILDATIGALWSDAEGSTDGHSLGADLSVSKILDSGGSVDFRAGAGFSDTSDSSGSFDSDLDLTFSQPLMRGAGYEVSHESLTQAERDMIYEVRDFELFREDYSIDIAEEYFGLVSQKQRLANTQNSYEQAVFDREKAEALRQVDRNQDEDVFNARRREVDEENRLLVARNNYKRAQDEFKIRLGLPTGARLEVEDIEPPFAPVRLDMASAVAVALHNRLDLRTREDLVVDARRKLRVARDGLRPDLDLMLGAGSSGLGEHFDQAAPDEWRATAGLTLGLPLDRQSERNAFRASMITLERAERELSLLRDTIERDVRNQLRSLLTTEDLIVIQRDEIEQERRAVAVTQIRVEAGDSDQRDLSDARQALVDAENALIELLAAHFIARLRLLRTMGVLFIDDEGKWLT